MPYLLTSPSSNIATVPFSRLPFPVPHFSPPLFSDIAELEIVRLVFFSDGARLLAASGVPSFELTVHDVSTAAPQARTKLGAPLDDVSFNPKNEMQFCSHSGGVLTLWNLERSYEVRRDVTSCAADLGHLRGGVYVSQEHRNETGPSSRSSIRKCDDIKVQKGLRFLTETECSDGCSQKVSELASPSILAAALHPTSISTTIQVLTAF